MLCLGALRVGGAPRSFLFRGFDGAYSAFAAVGLSHSIRQQWVSYLSHSLETVPMTASPTGALMPHRFQWQSFISLTDSRAHPEVVATRRYRTPSSSEVALAHPGATCDRRSSYDRFVLASLVRSLGLLRRPGILAIRINRDWASPARRTWRISNKLVRCGVPSRLGVAKSSTNRTPNRMLTFW